MNLSKALLWLPPAGLLLAACTTAPAAQADEGTAAQPTAPAATSLPSTARLEFIGHSCFMLTAPDGTRIVMDPYKDYTAPREIQMFPAGISADAVVISHFHPDHANSAAVSGARVIYQTGTDSVGAVRLTGYAGDHGSIDGAAQGANTVWVFEIGALKIVHTGANGLILQQEILEAAADADVVILRVGGDPAHPAREMVGQLRAQHVRTIIPSHYNLSTEYRFFTTLTVDEFTALLGPEETVVRTGASTLELSAGMPEQVVVLEPSALASQ
jgi:L-ascorbate metabolism protein UlaG (beta-lactamase superfamily)